MGLLIKRFFTKVPEKKLFGWTNYIEDIIYVKYPKLKGETIIQDAVIEGKKLCLFRKFIWDYQIRVINYKEYKK